MESTNAAHDAQTKHVSKHIENVANQFTHTYYYDQRYSTDRSKEFAAFKVFSNNLDGVIEDLKSGNDAKNALGMMAQVLDFKSDEARELALKVVEENFDDISRRLTLTGLEDSNLIGETPRAFEVLVKALDRIGPSDSRASKYFDIIEPVTDKVLQVIKSQNSYMAGNFAIFLLNRRLTEVDNNSPKLKETENLMKSLLFDQGVSPQSKRSFFKSLQENRQQNLVYRFFKDEIVDIIAEPNLSEEIADSLLSEEYKALDFNETYNTLHVCREIEAVQKGACKRINKLFGITHFGRYKPDFLLEQLTDWDNNDNANYGVILNPYGDWSNSFYESGDDSIKVSEKIIKGVNKFGFKTRVVEAKNKEEFVMRQLGLREHFEKAGNFYFLVIGAHGSPRSFTLGKGLEGNVSVWDIPLLKKDLSKLYQPYMQTIFFSCSTGIEYGFAEQWADSKIESIAPDKPGGPSDIEVFQRPGGLLGFAVKYKTVGEVVNQKRYPK